jgi:hypothetical protein
MLVGGLLDRCAVDGTDVRWVKLHVPIESCFSSGSQTEMDLSPKGGAVRLESRRVAPGRPFEQEKRLGSVLT